MYVSKRVLVAGGLFAVLLVLGAVVALLAPGTGDTTTGVQMSPLPSRDATGAPPVATSSPRPTAETTLEDPYVVDGEDMPSDEPTRTHPGDGRIPASGDPMVYATSVAGVLNSVDYSVDRDEWVGNVLAAMTSAPGYSDGTAVGFGELEEMMRDTFVPTDVWERQSKEGVQEEFVAGRTTVASLEQLQNVYAKNGWPLADAARGHDAGTRWFLVEGVRVTIRPDGASTTDRVEMGVVVLCPPAGETCRLVAANEGGRA